MLKYRDTEEVPGGGISWSTYGLKRKFKHMVNWDSEDTELSRNIFSYFGEFLIMNKLVVALNNSFKSLFCIAAAKVKLHRNLL